ncbi:FtsX-like permease family protein, partial [Streptomyces cinereoruber]|uniref:FtsX-like permease family protein n=1 Tax=Streptomyces cinereoruber TaxID=67260 RepID=UPI00362B4D96
MARRAVGLLEVLRNAAALGNEEIGPPRERNKEQRREVQEKLVGALAKEHPLPAGMTSVVSASKTGSASPGRVPRRHLMRAVGASRRQVKRAILLEAGVVGLVASVIGFALGVALAVGL